MRSLAELTDDNQIFPFLHHCFTWILRAGGSKFSETLLEGLPTEDTVFYLEKQGGNMKYTCILILFYLILQFFLSLKIIFSRSQRTEYLHTKF